MSRRASSSGYGRALLAHARMAPGGRVWSESPVKNTVRDRWTAEPAEAAVGPTPPDPAMIMELAPSSTSPDFTVGGTLDVAAYINGLITPDLVDGDIAVVQFSGADGVTMSVPSGWTTLTTGTQADLFWRIAWVRYSATQDMVISRTAGPLRNTRVAAFKNCTGWKMDITSITTGTGTSSAVPNATTSGFQHAQPMITFVDPGRMSNPAADDWIRFTATSSPSPGFDLVGVIAGTILSVSGDDPYIHSLQTHYKDGDHQAANTVPATSFSMTNFRYEDRFTSAFRAAAPVDYMACVWGITHE